MCFHYYLILIEKHSFSPILPTKISFSSTLPTPEGVPVKIISPIFNVKYLDI
jgi:hypothetical protein